MQAIVIVALVALVVPLASAEPAGLVAAGPVHVSTPIDCRGTQCGCGMSQQPIFSPTLIVRIDSKTPVATVTVIEPTRWEVAQCTDTFLAGECVFESDGSLRCDAATEQGATTLSLATDGAAVFARPVRSPYSGAVTEVVWTGALVRETF
ncbi:MAG: hypothetical protein ACYDCK_15455 [Thermoplasmatota archaeon]